MSISRTLNKHPRLLPALPAAFQHMPTKWMKDGTRFTFAAVPAALALVVVCWLRRSARYKASPYMDLKET